MYRVATLVSLVGINIAYSAAVAGASEDAMAVAVKARQQTFSNCDITIHVSETIAAGGVSGTFPSPQSLRQPIPDRETILESDSRVVLSGEKLRFENNHPIWALDRGVLLRVKAVHVADGSLSMSLYGVGLNDPKVPEGFVHRGSRSRDIKSYVLVPLTFHVRGADPGITAYNATQFKPTGAVLRIGSKACQEYTLGEQKAEVTRIWLDQEAGYLLRRLRGERAGKPVEQYDVDYRLDEGNRIVPDGWKRTSFSSDGKTQVSTAVRVTSFSVGHPADEGMFRVSFPPTAKVYDARIDKWYRIKSDDSMQEISLETGRDLPNTASQPGESWYARNRLLLGVAGGGLVVACIAAVAARRMRRVRAGKDLPNIG